MRADNLKALLSLSLCFFEVSGLTKDNNRNIDEVIESLY
jgi:hypothetical protein